MGMDNLYLDEYVSQMTDIMSKLHKDKNKKEIKKIVEKTVKKKLKDPEVVLDNNYTHEERDTTLISVLDWTFERKPIMAGNGTFYKNQHEEHNPAAHMLFDILAKRKAIRKRMFKVEDVMSRVYKDLDRS